MGSFATNLGTIFPPKLTDLEKAVAANIVNTVSRAILLMMIPYISFSLIISDFARLIFGLGLTGIMMVCRFQLRKGNVMVASFTLTFLFWFSVSSFFFFTGDDYMMGLMVLIIPVVLAYLTIGRFWGHIFLLTTIGLSILRITLLEAGILTHQLFSYSNYIALFVFILTILILTLIVNTPNNLLKVEIERSREIVSKLEQSEKKYRILVETLPHGVQENDLQGNITYGNSAYYHLHEDTNKELFGKKIWGMITNQEDQDELQDYLTYLSETEPEPTPYFTEIITRKGNHKSLQIDWDYLYNDNNELTSYISVITDISKQKHDEKLIKKSLQEKEIILKEVHHRVKNNLQVIYSLFDLKVKTAVSDETIDILNSSKNKIMSMALTYAALYQTPDFSKIRLKQSVDQLISYLQDIYSINIANVKVDNYIEDIEFPIDIAVPCNLIFNELISNAFKYAFPEDNEGSVIIKLEKSDDKEVQLMIKDDGIGLDREFEISDKTSSSLGLTIVNALVEQIDGHMEINTDAGTEIKITIPFSKNLR